MHKVPSQKGREGGLSGGEKFRRTDKSEEGRSSDQTGLQYLILKC